MLSLGLLYDTSLTLRLRVRFALSQRSERGASLTEYALLVALIAVTCIASIEYMGSVAGDTLSAVGASIGQP